MTRPRRPTSERKSDPKFFIEYHRVEDRAGVTQSFSEDYHPRRDESVVQLCARVRKQVAKDMKSMPLSDGRFQKFRFMIDVVFEDR
jgi:hypothetical protein